MVGFLRRWVCFIRGHVMIPMPCMDANWSIFFCPRCGQAVALLKDAQHLPLPPHLAEEKMLRATQLMAESFVQTWEKWVAEAMKGVMPND